MLELSWDPKQEIDTKWKWGDNLMNMLAHVRSSSYSFLKMWTVHMLASRYHMLENLDSAHFLQSRNEGESLL